MTIALNNRTFVGMNSLVIERLSDNVVYNFPVPQSFVVSPNNQQKVQLGRDQQGRTARLRSYIDGALPEMVITYSTMRPELISFAVGNRLVSGSYATHLPKLLQVTKEDYAAAATGYLGKGIVADAVTQASIITDNLSTALTQVAYATGPANPDEFSVGLDGALKFAPELIGEIVAMSIPYTVTANAWGDLLLGDHSIRAALVDTENKVTFFEAPLATVNLEGTAISPGSEAMELKFFLNTPPGECRAFNVYETTLQVAC